MTDKMDYDPDMSPCAPSAEEVQAVSKELFKMFGGKERLKREATAIPGVSEFTVKVQRAGEAYGPIIKRLAISYGLVVRDERDPEAYGREVLAPILAGDTDAIDKLKSRDLPAPYSSCMAFLIASTESIVEAVRADQQGNTSEAWCHFADAMYNLGKYEATFYAEPMARELHRRNGLKGVATKEDKKQPLRDFTRQKAIEGNYPTLAAALRGLVPLVKAEADRIEYSFRTHEPLDWIEEQIADIEFKRKSL